MAFRGYELNLVLRMQNRASTGLRRLAGDLGGVNKAAELQRKAAQLDTARNRGMSNRLAIAQKLETLTNADVRIGFEREKHEIRITRLKGDQARLQELVNRGSSMPGLQTKREQQLLATKKEILLIQNQERAAVRALNVEYAESVALLKAQEAEAKLINAQLVRADKQAALARKGRVLSSAGGAAMVTGGVGLLASGSAASSFAAFNRESVKTATQLRGVGEGFQSALDISKSLSAEILDMTRRFPAGANEMAKAAYEIASGMDLVDQKGRPLFTTQQRFNKTSQLLEIANRASVAGFVDLASVTDALITVFNNFDPRLEDTDRIMNTLFATVQYGKGTFEEFTPVFGRISASAKAAGQTLEEAGGAVAFLSQRLGSTSAAATGYIRLIQILGRKEFQEGFKSFFGISETTGGPGDPLKQLSTIVNIMKNRESELGPLKGTTLLNLIQKITARGQDIITGKGGHLGLQSTQNARTAIVNLVDGWEGYIDTLSNVTSNTRAFNEAFEAGSRAPGVRWQVAMNQFKAFGIVVGEQVLPVMLRFFDFLGRIAHHFENLSGWQKRLIGQMFAWGSILLVVGGALSLFAGKVVGLSAKFGNAEGAGLLGKLTKAQIAMRAMAAIGAIVISIELMKKGGLWNQLGGIFAAAFAGYIVGGPIGAIVIPIILEVSINSQPINDAINSVLPKRFKDVMPGDNSPMGRAMLEGINRERALKNKMPEGLKAATRDFQQDLVQNPFGAFHPQLKATVDANAEAKKTMLQAWQDYAAQLTGLDVYHSLSLQAASAAAQVQVNLAQAEASGNEADIKKNLRLVIEFDKRQIAKLKGMKKTQAIQTQLIQLYHDEVQARNKLKAFDKATDTANNKLETAAQKVENLKLKLAGLKDAAKSALESAFGSIGQGPLMSGPLGQAFSNISQTLAGFGITFPIPVSLTLGDLNAQQKNFDKLNQDINTLFKKGAPRQALEDLLGQGTSAQNLSMLEGVMQSGPGGIKKFVDALKKKQASIEAAAQSPWDKQIQAANRQYQAAVIQLKAAHAKEDKAKGKITTPKVTSPSGAGKDPKGRTLQSHTTNHNYNITASGTTVGGVRTAIHQGDFLRRHMRHQ